MQSHGLDSVQATKYRFYTVKISHTSFRSGLNYGARQVYQIALQKILARRDREDRSRDTHVRRHHHRSTSFFILTPEFHRPSKMHRDRLKQRQRMNNKMVFAQK